MARLIISSETGPTQIFELTTPTVSIGRAEVNDLVLDHPSISRHHARLSYLPGDTVLLNDLGSLNGTFVNGKKTQEADLQDGDLIHTGVFEIRFEASVTNPLHIETGETVPGHVADLLAPENLTPSFRTPDSVPAVPQEKLQERLRSLEKENRLLKLLLGVGKALAAVSTLEEMLQRVMELVFQMDNVERGFVMLRDDKGKLLPAVLLYKDENLRKKTREVALSRTLLDRVVEERLPLLIHDVEEDERFKSSESLRLSGVRSAMCAPLLYRDRVLGLFYVDCLTKVWAFSKEELGIFSVVAAEAAITLASVHSHQELAKRQVERKALERFLDSAAVERILSDPGKVHLGGESQKVTVLFVDLRGFTRMSEKMEPSAVVELLNDFFTEMTDLVFENGGTLDKYTGDGMMVVFGAPWPRHDDAQRAVRAAVEMQISLEQLHENWRTKGRQPIPMGVGINTGIVTAGNIGSTKRMDYTVIGDTVNLASRLCSAAAGGQILVSASTQRELRRRFPIRQLDPFRVKGREARVNVYEVGWQKYRDTTRAAKPDIPEAKSA